MKRTMQTFVYEVVYYRSDNPQETFTEGGIRSKAKTDEDARRKLIHHYIEMGYFIRTLTP